MSETQAGRRRIPWRWVVLLLIVSVLTAWLVRARVAPHEVAIIRAAEQPVVETLATTGRVRGVREASLGFDIGGVVAAVMVEEGDRVDAGATLMMLRTGELDAALEQARTQLAAAEADLRQAAAAPLPSERRRLEAQLEQAERVGEARVYQAQERVRQLEAGYRREEIQEAEAELSRAMAAADLARADFARAERLHSDGAISAADLDRARAALRTAEQATAAARSRLDLLRAGTREEEVIQGRAALRAAQAEAEGNREAARQALATLLATPRPEVIAAARARVVQARAALDRAEQQKRKAALVAPFAGVATDVPVEDGDAVSPGQTAIRLVELQDPEIEVETDEQNLALLRLGQEAVVTSEAYPGRSFKAALKDLGARSNPERGTLLIRLRPVESPDWLRSDLTVDVNVLLGESPRLLLPASAVNVTGGRATVAIAEDGRAVEREVVLGESGLQGVVVIKGIAEGEAVIADGAVRPGARVRARKE